MEKIIYRKDKVFKDKGHCRFIIFCYPRYEASGATDDIHYSSDSLEKSLKVFDKLQDLFDIAKMYDLQNGLKEIDVATTKKVMGIK